MPKKMTTLDFVTKAEKVHEGYYSYPNTVYDGNLTKVEIECPIHGPFEQTPHAHLNGFGCKRCGGDAVGKRRMEKAAKKFLERARDAHGDRYDYSSAVYTGWHEQITLVCPVHGSFSMMAGCHINGGGCKKCAIENSKYTQKEFEQKAKNRHGGKYDYSLAVYEGTETKVEIICKDHGVFSQTPHQHWRGDGCPHCAIRGYKTSKPGKLYVLEFENVTKIGVTNREVMRRVSQIRSNSGKKFSVVTYFEFEDGGIPLKMESQLIQEMREVYQQPTEVYDGRTESFINVDVQSLLARIRELSKELTE